MSEVRVAEAPGGPGQVLSSSDWAFWERNGYVIVKKAVPQAHLDAVIDAIVGVTVPNLSGGYSAMMPNHHITKPVLIGEIRADGQFDIISQTDPVEGDAWTDYLPESAVLKSDWKDLGCGMYNTETGTCVQTLSNY